MVLGRVFDRFVAGTPMGVMICGTLEYAFSETFINEVFERTAQRQYTRELLFSQVVDLMAGVVGQVFPTLNTGYQKQMERFTVSRGA